MKKKLIVAPSILSANFLNLDKELENIKKNGIEWIHYDVMDYHFVPNLTFGPDILKQINQKYNFKIDLHLMIETHMDISNYLKPFLNTGVDMITFHIEAICNNQIDQFLEYCKINDILCSIALKPKTSIDVIESYLPYLSNILIMSVEPGFGGQEFILTSIDKVKKLSSIRRQKKYNYTIEIDGGINDKTIHYLNETGIDMIVAGSYLFGQKNLKERIGLISYVEE